MASESQFLRAIMPTLPTEIAGKLRSLCTSSTNESVLENMVRFLTGGDAAPDASKSIQEQWSEKQAATRAVVTELLPAPAEKKRSREDDAMDDGDSQQSKKPRLTTTNGDAAPIHNGLPIFTLHAISATSPVRKKVDITIHQNTMTMTNSSSRAIESTIPLSSLRRSFIVPTRGRSKPYWTVILLSSDIPDKGKPTPGSSSENHQVIFGVDATSTTPFSTSTYSATGEMQTNTNAKGSATLPSLQEFLSKLNIPLIEPTVDIFKSVCPGVGSNAGVGGIPGVEAYRAAKGGSLWFSKEGILWGDSKPCEFWPVEELLGKSEGVRIVGSGRTCTVILTRRSSASDVAMEEDEEDVGEETEFGMVNIKEREGIYDWVRNHRHLFGKDGSSDSKGKGKEEEARSLPKSKPKPQNTGPLTIRTLQEGSDSEDDDFAASVSDLDGSERSSDEGSSEEEGGGGGSDEEEEGGGDEAASDEDGEGDEEEEDGELDPAKHPLLRPGAMPKMSKAALEMAVGIVENAFVGGGDNEEDEEDELED